MKTLSNHHSNTSNDKIREILKTVFPNSEIVATFACGSNREVYITKYGLALFITKNNNGMFDESLYKTTNNKQLDLHLH